MIIRKKVVLQLFLSNEKRLNITISIIYDMNQVLSVVVHKEKKFYVAECPEVGTVSQGETIEDAIRNLKEATELYLEEFPLKKSSKPFVSFFEVTLHGKTPKVVRA
jgi:predicted RNase H-like HicB family nuclease